MEDDPPEHNFSYPGQLVFNGLFSLEIKEEYKDLTPEEFLQELPQYHSPDVGEKAAGYKRNEFDKELTHAGDVTWNLQRFANDLYCFDYKKRTWQESTGYTNNGEKSTIQTPNDEGISIFWDHSRDLMVFKGQKSWLSKNRKQLRGGLSEMVRLKERTFDYDFFLWILRQKYIGQGLSTDLSVRRLTTAETTGNGEPSDNIGQDLRIEGSKNILRSVPVIASILGGKKPRSLEGYFVLDSNKVEAAIEHGGKIHVKVTDNELGELDHLRRMGVALRFIFELLRLYEVWQKLGPKEKYPPESFFYELAETMEEEGYDPVIPLKRVPEEYKRKRQGQMVDDNAPRESGHDAV